MASKNKAEIRRGVHSRIRKKVSGTGERPRLAVFRSTNHIYAQVINDDNGTTLASASTVEKDLGIKSGGNIDAAQKIGKTVAERALAAGVSQVVFDRGGYLYHGRVKALLDATRESGLNKNETSVKGAAASGESETLVESITDTVSSAVKTVADAVGDAITILTGGDAAEEKKADQSEPKAKEAKPKKAKTEEAQSDESAPKPKKKVKKENNENE